MKSLISMIVVMLLTACGGAPEEAKEQASPVVQHSAMKMGGAPQHDTQPDELVIPGYRSNYSIVLTPENKLQITNKITGEIKVYPPSKLIKFMDKYTSFDVDGPPGQVYRLYQAAFNRKPELAGLGFWIKVNQSGQTMVDIARQFIAAPEFQQKYGTNVSDSVFVNLLYNNVLHRNGEKGGLDFWGAALANGSLRETILWNFSESAENKKNILPNLVGGFDYTPFQMPGPIVPKSSSYENAKSFGLTAQQIPSQYALTNPVAFIEKTEGIQNGYAMGDFFHDGSMSMVAFTQNYIPTQDGVGHVYFYKMVDGHWVDQTATLLKDQAGCITPRKVIVADFNGDGKPDVFAACHGIDAWPLPPGKTQGEHPRMLLSQADGTYKNVDMGFNCYCHGASAAELHERGYADIVVTDTVTAKMPFFLINNHDGTFTQNMDLISSDVQPISYDGQTQTYARQIYSAELVDVDGDGKYDLWLGGTSNSDTTAFATSIFKNTGTDFSNRVVLPNIANEATALDITVVGNQAFMVRVNANYSAEVIQKIDLTTLASSVVFTNTNKFSNGMTWADWLIPSGTSVISLNSTYGITLTN